MRRIRRQRAERLARKTCHCQRVVRERDATTYVEESTLITIYGGPDNPEQTCKLQSFRQYETTRVSAGRPVVTQRTEIHVPIGAGPFQIGDLWEIEDHPYILRVAGLDNKSFQTMQHLLVDQVSNPGTEND